MEYAAYLNNGAWPSCVERTRRGEAHTRGLIFVLRYVDLCVVLVNGTHIYV